MHFMCNCDIIRKNRIYTCFFFKSMFFYINKEVVDMGKLQSDKLPEDGKCIESQGKVVKGVEEDVLKHISSVSHILLKEHLKASLLKIDNQDLVRKRVVLIASVLGFITFTAFAILQSNIIPFSNKNQITLFSNVFDFLALAVGLMFVLAALYNVFYLEKQRRKIEAQLKVLEGENTIESSKASKIADFCNKHANKVDLLGSIFTTTMQTIVIFCLTTTTIFQISQYPADCVFNVQGIVDTTGNILFVIAAGMFLLSYCIQQYKNKDKSGYKHNRQSTFIISAIFASMLLVCAGKIMFSFEATCGAIYTGHPGLFGDVLPLALIIRSLGMALFCVAYGLMLYNSTNANKQLKEEVDRGLLSKSLAAVDDSVSYNVSSVDDGQKAKVCPLPTILEESFSELMDESHKLIAM
ncbi:hypothetical protein FDZ58_04995 [Ehrlichia ruminantium]|nr:hypothetical protein AUR40_05245 [Ehrlichia ruminantium]QLK59237.1 hypothetical protein FDZ58_04995 [Ehrlichia ruminantium]